MLDIAKGYYILESSEGLSILILSRVFCILSLDLVWRQIVAFHANSVSWGCSGRVIFMVYEFIIQSYYVRYF